MTNKDYLVFGLFGVRYAINVENVREILPLPELTSTEELPDFIVGIFNIRGVYVPVMDLNIRFKRPRMKYKLSDRVLICESQNTSFGIIINEIIDVEEIEEKSITDVSKANLSLSGYALKNVRGIAGAGNNLVTIIDIDNILKLIDDVELAEFVEAADIKEQIFPDERYFSLASPPEERIIFKERALSYSHLIRVSDNSELFPLAVIGLSDEFIGIELKFVIGFSNISEISSVPCCPAHIIGQMNYRGDILTLIDIRSVLSLSRTRETQNKKVMIIQYQKELIGIPIDEIFDVRFFKREEIVDPPAAVRFVSDEYLIGTILYRDQMVSILNLEKVMQNGELTVNEEIA